MGMFWVSRKIVNYTGRISNSTQNWTSQQIQTLNEISSPDLRWRNISLWSTEVMYEAVKIRKTTAPSISPSAWHKVSRAYQNLLCRTCQASADTSIPTLTTAPLGEEVLFFSIHFKSNNNNVFRELWRSSSVILFDSQANTVKPEGDCEG